MRLIPKILTASLLAAIGACPVVAQHSRIETTSFGHRRPALGFVPCPPGVLPTSPYDPAKPGTPGMPDPKDPAVPPMGVDPGAQASLAGTGGGDATALPQSIGDQGASYRVCRLVEIPVFSTVTIVRQPTDSSGIPNGTPTVEQQVIRSTTLKEVCEIAASRIGAGFKIGDNESPRPMDRLFFTYNGYFSVPVSPGVPGATAAIAPFTISEPFLDTTISGTATRPAIAARSIDVHRWMFGFEKTLLDGDASVGLRLPMFGRTGNGDDGAFNGDGFGDMTIIGKYALINNRQNNNLLSTGLALTVPTGPAINSVAGNINSVLWQPFVGYIVNFGDIYFQGFSSVVVPTNSDDVVVMFNDVGLGVVLYRNFNRTGLTSIVPTIECHVTTPLNKSDVVEVLDTVSFTGGVHLGLGQRSWLTLGVNTPITGPRPYSVEGICQFNYRF
jgi:hypothetical protein